jgi:pimeloyl-ACP methyl ester carboxylesterase
MDAKIGGRVSAGPFDKQVMRDQMRSDIDCGGRPAFAEVLGEGPDVVFVGAAVPMALARPAAVALAGLGYRTVNFDYGSDAPVAPEPRSALAQVPDVMSVMDAVGVTRASIVGLSRGAMTAFGLAARHPERVERLILVFPVAGATELLEKAEPESGPEPGEGAEDFLHRSLSGVFSEEYLAMNLETVVELFTAGPGSVDRVQRYQEEPFSVTDSVNAPTLVLQGGNDRIVEGEHPGWYVENVPGARHLVVPEAGHGWLLEEPDRFAELVAEFITSS